MKILSKAITIVVITILIYVSFLVISDVNSILDEFSNFKFEYLPVIITLIISGYVSLILRWNLLLKKSDIYIPTKSSILIFMGGVSLSIIPGKAGELIKSELLKIKFDVPRSKSISIILVEQVYNGIGLTITSLFGLYYFNLGLYVTVGFSILVIFIVLFLSSKRILEKFSIIFSKIKFLNQFVENIKESQETVNNLITGKFVIKIVTLSTLFWIFISSAVYFIIVAFGIDTFEIFGIWTMYANSVMLGFVSFLPLGIGVVEGSFAGFMAYGGIDMSVALTLIIIIRVIVEWIPIGIGFISLKLSYNKKSNKKENSEE
tara:strand:+ start:2472 stop:3425 length:954 start_codon:yes stop_codon:yes gene_type:complete